MGNFHYELYKDGLPTTICFKIDDFKEIEKLKDELNRQYPKKRQMADERFEIYEVEKGSFRDQYFDSADDYLTGKEGFDLDRVYDKQKER